MSTYQGIPTPLTASALDSFTASHQASPTQTIRSYLGDQKSRQYPIEQLPPKSALSTPPRLPSSPRKDSRRAYEYDWGEARPSGTTRDSALQLIKEHPKQPQPPGAGEAAEPVRKRPSLVSQMKPRMSKPGTPAERPGTAGSSRPPLRAFRDVGNTPAKSSSPIIKPRKETQLLKEIPTFRTRHVSKRSPSPPPSPPSRRRKHDDQSNKENMKPTSPPKKRQRASSTTRPDVASIRKRVKLAAGVETESSSLDTYDELAARQFVPTSPHTSTFSRLQITMLTARSTCTVGLEARRLRRREKAAIVRDKTKAVVASAAEEGSRLRAKNKAKRRKEKREKGEGVSHSSSVPDRKKRKWRSGAKDRVQRLQELYQRPKTINKGRITVSVPVRFNSSPSNID